MFFGAIILNLISSYFLASIFGNLLIIFIAFFALVVLNMEILSIFGAISKLNVFIFSILNFLTTLSIFKYKKIPRLKINFDFKRLFNSLLLDKSLAILSFAFIIMLLVSLFLALVVPVLEPDSQTYHFIRAYEFAKLGSLAHFETNDIRALIMPINSEILYSWLFLFKKNFHGYGIVSFCSFILSICSMWSIFEKFKFAYRKRLYAIFLLSSLSAIIIQIPSLQTDLLVGSLLICAFSLFINNSIYFSSLSLALALGVKSTGVIALIAFFVLIILYELLIEKNKKLNKTKRFALFLPLNFLVFSSYNYILNLIQFHNPLSNHSAYLGHSFWGGFRGYIANLIHYFFQSFDFTGFLWGYYLNSEILNIKKAIFDFLQIDPMIGCNVKQDIVNIFTDEQTVGFGILGFLVYLPMIFISSIKIFFDKNKKTILLFLFALTFVLNILVLSRATAYMVFSIRFIVAFVVLSSIVLIGAYKKRSFLKPIIIFFCLFYMILISCHNARMPFEAMFKNLKALNYDLDKLEDEAYKGKIITVYELASSIQEILDEKYSNYKKIAFVKTTTSPALYLKKMELKGKRIDFVKPTNANIENLKNYDLVILEGERQNDNVFNPWDIKKDYKIENNRVIFNSNKNLNSFWLYAQNERFKYKDDALERITFTYPYLIQRNEFKLDYIKEVTLKSNNEKINVYYFINQIKD